MMLKEFPHIFAAVTIEMLETDNPIPLGGENLPSWDIPLFQLAEKHVAALPEDRRYAMLDAVLEDGTPVTEQPWYDRNCALFSELVSRVCGL